MATSRPATSEENPFADLNGPAPPPGPALGIAPAAPLGVAPAADNEPNPFADLPLKRIPTEAEKPPVTWGDWGQAAETGPLKATAGILSMFPDFIPNIAGLGTSAYDAYQHYAKGKDWADLPRPNEPNPVYKGITNLMDKSPITTTQVNRPDDAASRYISTAATALAGGPRAVIPAVAGQAAAEARPFDDEWKNQALGMGVQAATGHLQPFGPTVNRGGYEVSNANVQRGQAAGFKYPPATTNPVAGTRNLERVASKTAVQQDAAIHNMPLADNMGRRGIGLPGTGAVTLADIARIRREENQRYATVRTAGQLQLDTPQFRTAVAAATRTYSGAANVSPSLGRTDIHTYVNEMLRRSSHDAGDLMDTVERLRDEAKVSFRAGKNGDGAAYNNVARAIEDQMDRSLSANARMPATGTNVLAQLINPTQAQTAVLNFRAARTRLAQVHTFEQHWDSATGHIDAASLHNAREAGDYMSGPLADLADMAGPAPKAFKPVTHSPSSNHLVGSMAALAGAGEVVSHLAGGGEHGLMAALGGAAIPMAYHASRSGAKSLAMGPIGQHYAQARNRGPADRMTILGNLLATQGRVSGDQQKPSPPASK